MKWRFLWNLEPKVGHFLGAALMVNLLWFGTTLLIHDALKRVLGLDADPGYLEYDGPEDMIVVVIIPFVLCVPSLFVGALFVVENVWRKSLIVRARLGYGALSLALLSWCQWNLHTSLEAGKERVFQGYAITNTVHAAAYASIGFPLALACACFLLAILRRAPIFNDAR